MIIIARLIQDRKIRENEILNAAEELFHQYDYRRTMMSDISEKVGVVQGTLYYYFSSKEKIVEAIVNRHLTQIKDEIMLAVAIEVCPLRKIELVMNIFLKNLQCKQGLLLEYLYKDKNLHFMDKFFRQSKNLLTPFLLKIVKEGNQKGHFNVLHVESAVEYISSIILCNTEAIYKKNPKMILAHFEIAVNLLEKMLAVSDGSLKLKPLFISDRQNKNLA